VELRVRRLRRWRSGVGWLRCEPEKEVDTGSS
jgi:hypothetical protein